MALNITKSSEPITVDAICVTIYAQPGLGKTSLAYTAKDPILFDFDKGAYRAPNRGDVVQVSAWDDVAGVTKSDLDGYQTIIIDTVGKALDVLAQDVIKKSPKHGYGGALNQQGWGQLGTRFSAFLRMLRGYGKDVILISHMDEQKDGDQIKERLKISGGTKDLVSVDSDAMARISIHNRERTLTFSPTEASFGKDPAGIGQVVIPDVSAPEFAKYMYGVINSIKDKLNELSEEQVERKAEIEWFDVNLPNIADADGINQVLGRAKKAGGDIPKRVVARANELQLEFDAEARKYVYLEETGGQDDVPDELPEFEQAGPDVGDGDNT